MLFSREFKLYKKKFLNMFAYRFIENIAYNV